MGGDLPGQFVVSEAGGQGPGHGVAGQPGLGRLAQAMFVEVAPHPHLELVVHGSEGVSRR